MPRKNNRKVQPHTHSPSIYDQGFKQECYGCAFAGYQFVCNTSDGKCLKAKQKQEADGAGNGKTDRTG